jgi:hypothetical protein
MAAASSLYAADVDLRSVFWESCPFRDCQNGDLTLDVVVELRKTILCGPETTTVR